MNRLSKRHIIEGLRLAQEGNAQQHRDLAPTWCPGCGFFAPLHGLYEAVERLGIPDKDLVVVSGAGCSGRFPLFIKGFGFHAAYGNALAVATGIKTANPSLTVVVIGGADGDRLPHAARHNLDITYLLLDTGACCLDAEQVSPASPGGDACEPFNAASRALACGATFVARTFSGERDDCADVIHDALAHSGFSVVHVLSPCVELNGAEAYASIAQRTAAVPPDHERSARAQALTLAENEDPVYLGVFYRQERFA